MSVLNDNDRADVWAAFMRATPTPGATKPQLRAAVNAADDWIESHFAGFLAAIPKAIRPTPSAETLLANAAAIAGSKAIADVAAGVANRDQSGVLLQAYNAASVWLTTNAASYLTAVGTAAGGTLTQTQSFGVLEAVARRKAVV